MKNYIKIIKEIRGIKEFSTKKKNRIIRNAILTEVVNVWKPILKLPFTIIGITFVIICALFENIAEVLELIESIFENMKAFREVCVGVADNGNHSSYISTKEKNDLPRELLNCYLY